MRRLPLFLALLLCLACSQKPPRPKVVVYTPFPEFTSNELVETFEKRTGIEVECVRDGTTKIFGRVRAERENPRGDVWYGGGGMVPFITAASEGLLEPYTPARWKGLPERRGNLLVRDRDWNWMGMSVIGLGFAYNPQVLREDELPRTWDDLGQPQWKGKIEMWDPASSGTAMLFLCAALLRSIQAGEGEDAGWAYLIRYWKNMKNYTVEGKPAFNVARGESEIGIHFEHQVLEFLEEQSAGTVGSGAVDNIRWVLPPDSPVTVDPIALIKGGPNPENGRKFYDFVVSPEGQAIVNRIFFSIDPTLPPPRGLQGTITYQQMEERAMLLDPVWMADNFDAIRRRWQNEVEAVPK
ncbi:MAG: extracellular solute-binding protein [Candidatus Eremiobacterota bacterium]